jgi:uncharacterized membrane protein YkvA (DUF1232 family)
MSWTSSLRAWAGRIKRDLAALWIAVRDPRTPWHAKAAAAAVAAYAVSPIDLVPDFVPVLGQLALGFLDDLVIVPLGIMLAIKLIPDDLMPEFREKATRLEGRPASYAGVAVIVLIWLAAMALQLWRSWPLRPA